MNKALFIVGPTGVGKTNLGLKLSSKFQGSVISADSVQVYKGLDIISGKDIPPHSNFFDISGKIPSLNKSYTIGFYDFENIPVFMLDVVPPTYNFSVSHFLDCAIPVTKFIELQNKLPIFVGGTGLYVKSILDGIDTVSIPPNIKLRKKFEHSSIAELAELLKKQNRGRFEQMTSSDKKNKRRLIRSLEILNSKKKKAISKKLEGYDIFTIGLFCERSKLRKRIEERVSERIKVGAFEEAESLFRNYKNLSPQVQNANGYKQMFEHLLNKTNRNDAIEKWKISEYRHAKNQMTWFQKDARVHWFDISENKFEQKLENEVSDWYNTK